MTQNQKIILSLLLFMTLGTVCLATEVLSGLDAETDLPVLNEELRDINSTLLELEDDIEAVASVPTGALLIWSTDTAPTGYLLCDGSAVSRTDYADLFAVISTDYGVGDGSTTFNVPDLIGRVAVGLDADDTRITDSADTLAETGGAATHTLTESEMPSHTHTYAGGSLYFTIRGDAGSPPRACDNGQQNNSTGSAGSDTAHNNLQPFITLNYVIKT